MRSSSATLRRPACGLFLATEVLFFGGLFFGYTVYRLLYPQAFHEASRHTLVVFGTINTALLLTSSLVMALAVSAAEQKERLRTTLLLLLTAGMGALFLVLKGIEYHTEIHEGLLPGAAFVFPGATWAAARIFFSFYFVMTGVHAVHVTIGVVLLLLFAFKKRRSATAVEVLGLVLAFCGPCLGVPFSAALPRREVGMSTPRLVVIAALLLALLALTVALAYVNLGWCNTPAAMGIAAIKALLILLFFMQLRRAPGLQRLFAAAGFVWLALLLLLSLSDYLTR